MPESALLALLRPHLPPSCEGSEGAWLARSVGVTRQAAGAWLKAGRIPPRRVAAVVAALKMPPHKAASLTVALLEGAE